jgi:hypothetical protein
METCVWPIFRDRSCVLNKISNMAILAPIYVEYRIQRLANGNVMSLSQDNVHSETFQTQSIWWQKQWQLMNTLCAFGFHKGRANSSPANQKWIFPSKWRSGSALHLCSSRTSRCFPQSLHANFGIVPKLGQDRFLPNPLQLFAHYDPTIRRPATWDADGDVKWSTNRASRPHSHCFSRRGGTCKSLCTEIVSICPSETCVWCHINTGHGRLSSCCITII